MDKELLLSDPELSLDDRRSLDSPHSVPHHVVSFKWRVHTFVGLFVISVLLNLYLLINILSHESLPHSSPPSRYAGLQYTQELLLPYDTDYSLASNETHQDELWESLTDMPGVVALDEDFVLEKNPPKAYRFPWDDSKGVYVVASYHYLHCLRALYIAITEAHRGHSQSFHYYHLIHCLDRWRQEVLCHADDTLLYVQEKDDTLSESEYNIQRHQCRDWNQLTTWVREHTACYTYHHFEHPHKWDNYKNCPPDSPYLPKVREHFHLPPDWLPHFED